ncbi:Uncharacterised protein [Segatella copri]|nr:Uncharacterised protein [Segatella copri]
MSLIFFVADSNAFLMFFLTSSFFVSTELFIILIILIGSTCKVGSE